MAIFVIKVDRRTGMTYLPKALRAEGFVGQIRGLPDTFTFTLVKPGTNLSCLEKSLQIVLDSIKLRREAGED